MPATSPLAMEGTAPSRMTVYIIWSFRPSQITAGGTQATEGSDWSPDRIGPRPERMNFTRATTRPSGVAIASAMRKPNRPRETLVQTMSSSSPSTHSWCSASQTRPGSGSL